MTGAKQGEGPVRIFSDDGELLTEEESGAHTHSDLDDWIAEVSKI
jgi:hypothetical protein